MKFTKLNSSETTDKLLSWKFMITKAKFYKGKGIDIRKNDTLFFYLFFFFFFF